MFSRLHCNIILSFHQLGIELRALVSHYVDP